MLNCQECKTPCFDFEETALCPREASLPPDVCPMFEEPVSEFVTEPGDCFFSAEITH